MILIPTSRISIAKKEFPPPLLGLKISKSGFDQVYDLDLAFFGPMPTGSKVFFVVGLAHKLAKPPLEMGPRWLTSWMISLSRYFIKDVKFCMDRPIPCLLILSFLFGSARDLGLSYRMLSFFLGVASLSPSIYNKSIQTCLKCHSK